MPEIPIERSERITVDKIVEFVKGWQAELSFDGRAYNRLTGKHVTTWDAVWLDLRIQEQVK